MSSLALLFFPQNLKNDIVNFGGEDYTTDDADVAALKMKPFLFCSQRMGFNGSLPVLFHLVAQEPALGLGQRFQRPQFNDGTREQYRNILQRLGSGTVS